MSKNRTQSLIQLALFVGVLLFLNVVANRFYTHLDLTEDKRFSLTKATKSVVKNLDDNLFVNVYMDGEFSSDVKRLKTSVTEMLDKFKSLSGNVEYQLVNPLDGSPDEINKTLEELRNRGIFEYVDKRAGSDEFSAKRVFPGATLYYKGREISVYFLEKATPGTPKQVRFNNSISMLEYNLANAIQKLKTIQKPKITFITGHGELFDFERADFEASLKPFYDVAEMNLDSVTVISDRIDVAVIAKPRGPYSDRDKFKIDQYVMNGGKVLWLVDQTNAGIDSLRTRGEVLSGPMPHQLDDLIFRYGARINSDLILDLQSSRIPLQVGIEGGRPQFDLKFWYYFPIILPDAETDHPIVKNLDGIDFKFVSTIDTLKTKTPVKKTVLLTSSENSRFSRSPSRLTFDITRTEPNLDRYNNGNKPVAILLEGTFPSLYQNRVTESMAEGLKAMNQEFKPQSEPTKMIVVSDGDVARNHVDLDKKELKPLGYNIFEQYTFANRDFLLNCIEYLMDSDGLIGARSKEVKLRLLNKAQLRSDSALLGIPMKEKTKRQVINLLLPLILLILFGIGYNYLRKRRYAV
ncbi:MAG: gliding motility-associated ABC transporter substrate-binding protein GldG [Bacteroidota bacterium]